LKNISYIKVWI